MKRTTPSPLVIAVAFAALVLVVGTVALVASSNDDGQSDPEDVTLAADSATDHADEAAEQEATDQAVGDAIDEEHGHLAGENDTGGHDTDEHAATDDDLPYPASFVSWLDTAPTPEARDRAEKLLIETTEAMQAFPDEAAVQAAGFVSIGDGATGWEHYINVDRIMNPAVLDPSDIESIVLKVNPDGTKQVASAMYLLPFGTTMEDAPDIAGDLTTWHDHQNLCWEGVRVVGTTGPDGSCARGEFRPTQPMIHVWLIDHPCGPFAGIDGSHGEGCGHEH